MSTPTTTNGTRNGGTSANGVAPPHSLEAEQSVLGGILLSDRAMYGLVIEEGLKAGDFYRDRHRLIYDAMCRLHGAGEPVDVLTVADQLERDGRLADAGGRAAIDELTGGVPGLGAIRRYAQIVTDTARARELLNATYEIQARIAERRHDGQQLLADAEQTIFRLGQSARRTRDTPLVESLEAELERLELAANSEEDITGLPTGFNGLDEKLNGLHPGRLYVIAARPAMGKTTIVQNIAAGAALRRQKKVLFASLEMGESELAQRHLAAESGVAHHRIERAQLTDNDWPPLLETVSAAAKARFFTLDEPDLSVFDLRAHARQVAVREAGLDLVVVDYLQLMRADPPSNNRTEDVSSFSRGLKRLARELECPVIAVAQLSRQVEQRTDKRPLLSDLRESGQIEADADAVIMLYRDDYYHEDSEMPGETELIVRKNRQGKIGDCRVKLLPGQRFIDLPDA
jgi:replicative DNA helicase